MKTKDVDSRTLLSNLLITVFVSGTVGIALKFFTYFNHWVYFPSFPNALDSAFLILSVTYFTAYIIYKNRQNTTKTESMKTKAPIDTR